MGDSDAAQQLRQSGRYWFSPRASRRPKQKRERPALVTPEPRRLTPNPSP